MTDCGYCPFDGSDSDCDECDIPEFTDIMYRDTCDLCGDYIMVPYPTRDNVNVIVCKDCSKRPAKDLYEELDPDGAGKWAIRDFEGVFVEGDREWWKDVY